MVNSNESGIPLSLRCIFYYVPKYVFVTESVIANIMFTLARTNPRQKYLAALPGDFYKEKVVQIVFLDIFVLGEQGP